MVWAVILESGRSPSHLQSTAAGPQFKGNRNLHGWESSAHRMEKISFRAPMSACVASGRMTAKSRLAKAAIARRWLEGCRECLPKAFSFAFLRLWRLILTAAARLQPAALRGRTMLTASIPRTQSSLVGRPRDESNRSPSSQAGSSSRMLRRTSPTRPAGPRARWARGATPTMPVARRQKAGAGAPRVDLVCS